MQRTCGAGTDAAACLPKNFREGTRGRRPFLLVALPRNKPLDITMILSPSLLSADFARLAEELVLLRPLVSLGCT